MSECEIYLYGIVPFDTIYELNLEGIDDVNTLYYIQYEGLKAIVSNVAVEEYNEETFARNVEDMNWLKQKAVLHSNIINELFNNLGNIIPVKFGSIFITEQSLHNFLSENYEQLNHNIGYTEGKEEWGIKLYGDINKFIDNNMEDEKKEILQQVATVSKGAGYFIQKKLLSTIEEKAKDKIIALSQKMFNELSAQSVESKLNKLLSKEATGIPVAMYLNSVFLIDKNSLDLFKKLVGYYKKEYKNIGLYIEETGPWPAYNFC